jgi:hypothetical protein
VAARGKEGAELASEQVSLWMNADDAGRYLANTQGEGRSLAKCRWRARPPYIRSR